MGPFETKILNTLLGLSHPGRAKEIVFSLLCAGPRIAPSILIPYGRATWLARLCKTRGPVLITSQSMWEHQQGVGKSGPFGRVLHTLQSRGWVAGAGCWEWRVPGLQDPLKLTGDYKQVKHDVREQLRAPQIDQLVCRRPRQFAGSLMPACFFSPQSWNAPYCARC